MYVFSLFAFRSLRSLHASRENPKPCEWVRRVAAKKKNREPIKKRYNSALCSSPSGSCKQLNIMKLYRFFYKGSANQKRQGNQLSFLSFARSIVGFSFFVPLLWVGFPFFVPCCGFRSLSLRSFVSFASLSWSVLVLRPALRRKTNPTPFTAKLDI